MLLFRNARSGFTFRGVIEALQQMFAFDTTRRVVSIAGSLQTRGSLEVIGTNNETVLRVDTTGQVKNKYLSPGIPKTGDLKWTTRNMQMEAGWLVCNGQSMPIESFPDLFEVIGYTFGGGEGMFVLPLQPTELSFGTLVIYAGLRAVVPVPIPP